MSRVISILNVFIISLILAGHSFAQGPVTLYGVVISFDKNKMDPEVTRELGKVNITNQIKVLFPDAAKTKKTPKELQAMIEKLTTEKAIAFDKVVMNMAKREAVRVNKTAKDSKDKVVPEDIILELSGFIRDGDYKSTKVRFPTIQMKEFKEAQQVNLDFVLLAALNDQIPQ